MPKRNANKARKPRSSRRRVPKAPRRLRVVRAVSRGKGGYWNKFQDWSHGSGQPWMDAGRSVANAIIPGSGAVLKGVSNILGLGAYDTNGGIIQASPVPAMHSVTDTGVRIAKSQMVVPIYGSDTFTLRTYRINPGNKSLFKWLGPQANSYTQYKMNGLSFIFKSTSSPLMSTTTTSIGMVAGACQYNNYGTDPTNMQEVMTMSGANYCKPNDSTLFPIECRPQLTTLKNRLVRSDALPDDDLQKYDMGKFYIATEGNPFVGKEIGQLWISYDVIMIQPKFQHLGTSAHYYGTAGITATHTLPTTMLKGNDPFDLSFNLTTGVMTIPPGCVGRWMLQVIYQTGSTAVTYADILSTNVTGRSMFCTGPTNNIQVPDAGTTCTVFSKTITFDITDPAFSPTIQFPYSGNTIATNPSHFDLILTQLADDAV